MGNAPLCVIIALVGAGHARPAGERLTDTNGKPAGGIYAALTALLFCLHIRPKRIRHGVYLGQVLGGCPDIAVGQLTRFRRAFPSAKFPNLVRKYVLCGRQRRGQRGLHAQFRQRSAQFVPCQRLFPCGGLPQSGQQAVGGPPL